MYGSWLDDSRSENPLTIMEDYLEQVKELSDKKKIQFLSFCLLSYPSIHPSLSTLSFFLLGCLDAGQTSPWQPPSDDTSLLCSRTLC